MRPILLFLLLFSTVNLQAQHAVGIDFGRSKALNSPHYLNGVTVQIAYEYQLPIGIIVGSSFGFTALNVNPSYSIWDDPVILAQNDNDLFRRFAPASKSFFSNTELFNTNFSIEPFIGYRFYAQRILQPSLQIGFSYNETHQSQTLIEVNNSGLNLDLDNVIHRHFGLSIQPSLRIRLSEHSYLRGSYHYVYLPNAITGYEKGVLKRGDLLFGYQYSF